MLANENAVFPVEGYSVAVFDEELEVSANLP